MSAFNSLYASQYDELYAEKNYTAECDILEDAFRRHSINVPRSLLDVGCGTGGHSIELASRGFAVTGVDLSQSMLDRAVAKAGVLIENSRPEFLQGDARSFSASQSFDAAIMMFAVVGYLTTNDDVLTGLRNIRRHLNLGATFVCDFWYGPSVLSVRPTDRIRELTTPGGRVIRAASTTLDIASHTADVKFKLWSMEGDRLIAETDETHRMRYFFPQEFSFFLSLAGFQLKSLTAFPSLTTELNDQTWNAVAVATAVN
jgi:SAM-dependent methyltransferase